ncbi:MAG TPA: DUF72 domain-containing protein, partial [Candidatus Angelobacter sp.]|nr:DUF72 domain-containing protein [Candidatus Angelobacter sp.]
SWKPSFFPEKLPSKRFLEFYGTRLNAVELNATFRRMPSPAAIAGWVNATPPDFRFAAKVHQSITHFKRLKDAEDSMRFFLQSMEPMRESGKLGPILIQTPPNLKADTDLLRTFVQCLPQVYKFAFEFRHESWFNYAVYEILKSKNAALCWAESEKITAPKVPTADFVYYRFREPEYSTPDLQQAAQELQAQRAEREVYAFFKHEEKPESALNAVQVARLNGIEEKPFAMPEKKVRAKK